MSLYENIDMLQVIAALDLIVVLRKLNVADDIFFGTVSGRNWNTYYTDADKFALIKKKAVKPLSGHFLKV